jgi:hypothetical protein
MRIVWPRWMWRTNKKLREEFLTKVTALLLELGATKRDDRPDDFPEFYLNTKYGRLRLNVCVSPTMLTLFTAFDEPGRAVCVGCNSYSGKWNHHYDNTSLENILSDLRFKLKRVLKEGD